MPAPARPVLARCPSASSAGIRGLPRSCPAPGRLAEPGYSDRFLSPVVLDYALAAAVFPFDGTSGFDELQNGNDLVFSESDLTHSDLLRGHNQYVGRSLKVNGTKTGVLTLELATALNFSRIGVLIRLVVAHYAKLCNIS